MPDTAFSQLVYYLSGRRYFKYTEDKAGFQVPESFVYTHIRPVEIDEGGTRAQELEQEQERAREDEEKRLHDENYNSSSGESISKEGGEEKVRSCPNGIMVGWYGYDDPENPKNWTFGKKCWVSAQILTLTFSIYIGSSIYTPAIGEIMEDWHISETAAIVPLSVFVFGYGLGPVVFSPLSEHPVIGRLWIYIITLFIFVVLQIPTALIHNIGSLIALRFIAGVFSSPALATSGATFGDMFEIAYIPFALAFWALSAICGPVFGPVLGGVFAQVMGWKWTFWVLTMISGACLIVLFFFFPETSEANILYRRARRLRRITGKPYTTESREEWRAMKRGEVAYQILLRPVIITVSEPIVFALGLYIALLYATLYTWFEAFPIVFTGIHHFNLIESGLAYFGLIVGGVLGCAIYIPLVYVKFTKPVLSGNFPPIAMFMKMCLIGSVIFPLSIFFFGWTSHKDIHWIVPIIASMLCVIGMLFIFQTVFNYLSGSYPRFIASVFAGNGLFRAGLAGAFPIFAHQMFDALGPKNFPVGYGSTLVGCIACLMGLIPVVLIMWGDKLKGHSKWAN